jgi:hypothetical protein
MARAAASLEDPSLLTSLSEWSKKNAQEQPPARRKGFLSSSSWKVFSDALPLLQAGVGGYLQYMLGFAHSYLSLRNTTHDQRDSWDAPLVLFGTTGRWPFAKPWNGSHALSGFPVRICIAVELLSQQKLKNDQLFARNDFFTWSTVTRMKRCRKMRSIGILDLLDCYT